MDAPTKKFRTVDLDTFSDEDSFNAWGYAFLKVVQGEEVLAVRVKIGSIPHEEVEKLRKRAPRPPSVMKIIDPTSEEGRSLGITQRGLKTILQDFSNEKYQDEMQAFNIQFNAEVVGRGVLTPVRFKDGRDAKTPEEKYMALQEKGLSVMHFGELSTEILNLTNWSDEERGRFLTSDSGLNPGR